MLFWYKETFTKILSGKKYNGQKYEIIENNPYVKYQNFTSLV